MKLRKYGLLLAIPLAFFAGCEDEGAVEGEDAAADAAAEDAAADEAGAEDDAAEGEGEGEAEGPDAAAACAALIEAVGAKNVDAVVGMSGAGAGDMITAESIEGIAAAMNGAACGEATVDGESASVSVTVGEDTRNIKFALSEGAWKWDAAAYAADYPPPEAPAKSKKKGKKKGKKKKGKKKKKKK